MKKIRTLYDLTEDPRNANEGTERGSTVLQESLERLGAGRSILADKNGVLIAGNKTHHAAIRRAIGNREVLVVESDGSKLVVVQRTDLDVTTDEKARQLAFADNRAGQVSLQWNPDAFPQTQDAMKSMDWLFTPEEIYSIISPDKTGGSLFAADNLQPVGAGQQANGHGFSLKIVFNTEKDLQRAKADLTEQGYAVM